MAADVIGLSITRVVSRTQYCKIMLTGGNTAARLYERWAKTSALAMERLQFFFGDERCVAPTHKDSNFDLVMRTLFVNKQPLVGSVSRMEADDPDREAAASRYEQLLPESIDILLLGMGTDGHIASLFPHSDALRSTDRTVLPVRGPNSGHPRLSITGRVVANAAEVFLLATGAEKGQVLAEALSSPRDVISLPVRLALNGTWLLDDAAARELGR